MKKRLSALEKKVTDPNARAWFEEVLRDSVVLRDHPTVATELAAVGTPHVLAAGTALTQEHSFGDEVFFVLSGKARVLVNNQPIAERVVGELLGEMALLDPGRARSATLAAADELAVLEVKGDDFLRILGGTPIAWKGIARQLADRLRARRAFLPRANTRPIMFLGSSVEKLPALDAFVTALAHDAEPKPWPGVFGPSRFTLPDLLKAANECDYATFVFAADDTTSARHKRAPTVRDNVILEAGLMIGVLGIENVFLAKPRGAKLHLPSDLNGLNTVEYLVVPSLNVVAAAAEIRKVMQIKGLRTVKCAPV